MRNDEHLFSNIYLNCFSAETDQSESSSTKAVGGEAESKVMPDWTCPDERVATFTDYSISSSVVPRNKGEGERESKKMCLVEIFQSQVHVIGTYYPLYTQD